LKVYYIKLLVTSILFIFLTSCSTCQIVDGESFSLNNKLRLYVVPNQRYLPGPTSTRRQGCATANDEIYVIPRSMNKDGTYNIDTWLLGHELKHLLHFKYPNKFRNPDRSY
jgi:hypothetical protein